MVDVSSSTTARPCPVIDPDRASRGAVRIGSACQYWNLCVLSSCVFGPAVDVRRSPVDRAGPAGISPRRLIDRQVPPRLGDDYRAAGGSDDGPRSAPWSKPRTNSFGPVLARCSIALATWLLTCDSQADKWRGLPTQYCAHATRARGAGGGCYGRHAFTAYARMIRESRSPSPGRVRVLIGGR